MTPSSFQIASLVLLSGCSHHHEAPPVVDDAGPGERLRYVDVCRLLETAVRERSDECGAVLEELECPWWTEVGGCGSRVVEGVLEAVDSAACDDVVAAAYGPACAP